MGTWWPEQYVSRHVDAKIMSNRVGTITGVRWRIPPKRGKDVPPREDLQRRYAPGTKVDRAFCDDGSLWAARTSPQYYRGNTAEGNRLHDYGEE